MAALGGAALGATVGGLTGALIGMGIPELEAKRYEGKIGDGNILISVHTDDSEEQDAREGDLPDARARSTSRPPASRARRSASGARPTLRGSSGQAASSP